MPRLEHSPGVNGLFTDGGDTWMLDRGVFTVDDPDRAAELVRRYTKISWLNTPPEEEDAAPDCPTNNDGEPLCVGKDDGQCKRVVDTLGGTCWQH